MSGKTGEAGQAEELKNNFNTFLCGTSRRFSLLCIVLTSVATAATADPALRSRQQQQPWRRTRQSGMHMVMHMPRCAKLLLMTI